MFINLVCTFLYDTAQLQFEIAFYQQHEHTVTHLSVFLNLDICWKIRLQEIFTTLDKGNELA